MFGFIRRLLVLFTILGLLILNVLTLTVSGINALVSGLMASAFGVSSVTSSLHSRLATQQNETQKMASKVEAQRVAAQRIGTRLVSRSRRMAIRTMASMPAKALPIVGTTVIVAGTIWELRDLCEGLGDVKDLYAELEIDEPLDRNALQVVCRSEPSLAPPLSP